MNTIDMNITDLYTASVFFDPSTSHYGAKYVFRPDPSIAKAYPLVGVDPYDGRSETYLAPVFLAYVREMQIARAQAQAAENQKQQTADSPVTNELLS